MTLELDDAQLLARSHRRRKWTVRISLVSLAVLVLLTLAALVLTSSSSMTIEEAKAICDRLESNRVKKSLLVSLLGKPLIEQVRNNQKICWWYFARPSLDKVELFTVYVIAGDDELSSLRRYDTTITGWESWKVRWRLLRMRLGFKPE
jgi:hypothetical protein